MILQLLTSYASQGGYLNPHYFFRSVHYNRLALNPVAHPTIASKLK